MLNFLKRFKKECVNTCEQLEKEESETKEPEREEQPIAVIINSSLFLPEIL